MTVPKFETFSYNSFEFPVETKLEIDFDPKYDRADRSATGVSHLLRATVTLKTDTLAGMVLSNGFALTGTNETDLPAIFAVLTKPGQELILTETGFGDLSVNGANEKQDSAWGPKPRRCTFMPLGTNACVLRWHCEVLLPTCLDAVFQDQIMAYNYGVSVSIDEQGYCTRTINGYFEIPLTRSEDGGDTVSQSALDFWGPTTQPPVPTNFRRTQTQATESDDRRKLTFTVVDVETNDVILPPNVVECRASHSVITADKALNRMIATLRASYTLRKGVPKQDAFVYFLLLLWQKWQAQTQITQGGTVNKISIIPISLTMEDPDIYGRQAGNFSMTWSYNNFFPDSSDSKIDLQQASANLVPNSALWNPGVKKGGAVIQSPQGNSWGKWRQSMNTVFGTQQPRFSYAANDDFIVDLCGTGLLPQMRGQFFRVADYGTSPASLSVRVDADTFIKYDTSVSVDNRNGMVFRPAPSTTKRVVSEVLSSIPFFEWASAAGADLLGDVQTVGSSQTWAYLYFDIVQVGNTPTIPTLSKVGNVNAIYHSSGKHTNYLHAILFGVPAYGIKGFDVYVLQTAPGTAPDFPPNYYLGNKQAYPNVDGLNNLGL